MVILNKNKLFCKFWPHRVGAHWHISSRVVTANFFWKIQSQSEDAHVSFRLVKNPYFIHQINYFVATGLGSIDNIVKKNIFWGVNYRLKFFSDTFRVSSQNRMETLVLTEICGYNRIKILYLLHYLLHIWTFLLLKRLKWSPAQLLWGNRGANSYWLDHRNTFC